MIAGLETPSSGQVLIGGEDVTRRPTWERDVGMVFQSYALFPHMTVLDNVGYGLRSEKRPVAEAHDRAREALATVGLATLAERFPAELSGGQQQRVALARAIVLAPAVLLFDEPLSNLDARLRREMREEIRALQQRLGVTVVYVTHDQAEALAVSDRIVIMDRGRIAGEGAPRDLYEKPQTEFVARFMGEANIVPAIAVRDGGGVASVEIEGLRWPAAGDGAPWPGALRAAARDARHHGRRRRHRRHRHDGRLRRLRVGIPCRYFAWPPFRGGVRKHRAGRARKPGETAAYQPRDHPYARVTFSIVCHVRVVCSLPTAFSMSAMKTGPFGVGR
jgi:ABC-type nitrate/sulfonate/bicarbonate transport system ATPase subunit